MKKKICISVLLVAAAVQAVVCFFARGTLISSPYGLAVIIIFLYIVVPFFFPFTAIIDDEHEYSLVESRTIALNTFCAALSLALNFVFNFNPNTGLMAQRWLFYVPEAVFYAVSVSVIFFSIMKERNYQTGKNTWSKS